MSRTVVYPDAEAFFAAVEHADPKVRGEANPAEVNDTASLLLRFFKM
jgi:hypothetical protein